MGEQTDLGSSAQKGLLSSNSQMANDLFRSQVTFRDKASDMHYGVLSWK